jgi:hypothetical protein
VHDVQGILDAGSQSLAGGGKFEPLMEELSSFLAPCFAVRAYGVNVEDLEVRC